MEEKQVRQLHQQTVKELNQYKLQSAIANVRTILGETGLSDRLKDVDQIQDTYRYMIHYLVEGLPDKERETVHSSLVERLRFLNDLGLRAAMTSTTSGYYYEALRFNRLRQESVSDIFTQYGSLSSELALAEAVGNDTRDMRRKKEELLVRLFNTLLTSMGDDRQYKELSGYVLSGYAENEISGEALASVTLSLLVWYDRAKLSMLFDIFEKTDSDFIAAHALPGIIFTLAAWPRRVAADKELTNRMLLWGESDVIFSRIRETIRVIIGTRDTERIVRKMQEDVLPEMMKLRPELLKKMREASSEPDLISLEDNPEWEKMLNKSGLGKKMQELSEMQSDGGDLMMVAFSNLKQFPFFNAAANWFLPFDSRHTDLGLDKAMSRLVDTMHGLGQSVCDSDMYSLALALKTMPENQRAMVTGQLSAQFDQMNEQLKAEAPHSKNQFNTEVLKAVRELYRFFKLFRKSEGFHNPFETPLQFISLPVIGDLMNDDDVLELIGEFYFKRGYYAEALPLLRRLVETNPDDATLWEKIGFCLQSLSDLPGALDAYDKASLLKAPGAWLVKKLAYVNRRLGNYEKAAEYYEQALDMEPENATLLMNAGHMLLESGEYDGAATHYYHVNYLRPDNLKVHRAIAWVEMLRRNFEKSREFYDRIESLGGDWNDMVNAGHLALVQGKISEAVELYRTASLGDFAKFEQTMIDDLHTLQQFDIDRRTLSMIIDAVR